jgi:hypothetical protein
MSRRSLFVSCSRCATLASYQVPSLTMILLATMAWSGDTLLGLLGSAVVYYMIWALASSARVPHRRAAPDAQSLVADIAGILIVMEPVSKQ